MLTRLFRPMMHGWRQLHLLGLLFASVMLAIVLYLQITTYIFPCLFCVYLRGITILYGLTSALALFYIPKKWGKILYKALFILYSVIGVLISIHLLRLQIAPVETSQLCSQGLSVDFSTWPFAEIFSLVLTPYGDCVALDTAVWGISLPFWSLMAFMSLLLFELFKPWLADKIKGDQINLKR